jgi:hypothetical protein
LTVSAEAEEQPVATTTPDMISREIDFISVS